MNRSTLLFLLWSLFTFRVLAQLIQFTFPVPLLPPFSAWQSGVLPYPILVFSQLIILTVLFRVSLRHAQGKVEANRELGKRVFILGTIYAAVMVTRYILHMVRFPEDRWIGGSIPIFFHLVLAGFLLTVGIFHLKHGPVAAEEIGARTKWLWRGVYALIGLGIAAWLAYQIHPIIVGSQLEL